MSKDKKMKKLNEQQMMNMPGMLAMPVNGVSMLPDGKTPLTPQPVVKANNLAKAQVPTPAAAMAGAFAPNMMGGSSQQSQQEPEVEEEEEEESEPTEVEESANENFRSALISLLGENISPDAVSQLEGIFEAAVNQKVDYKVQSLVTKLDEGVQEYLNNVTTTLVEKVDDYLDYVVEEWMQDNQLSVEQGIKTQIAENFINGLKNLFENHYIDVPNEKYNALDELYAQNRELEESLNQTINENMQIKKNLMINECATVFVAETRDLADTQIEKLQSLMENVSFENVNEYRNKLMAIKDNYLNTQSNFVRPSQPVSYQPINEEMTFSAVKPIENNTVENYANVIGRLNKKI
jgi:hypothetical protein